MEYTLMHKNVAVAQLEIFEDTGAILKTLELTRPEHLPLGIRLTPQGKPETKSINDWWVGRAIPASRSGLRDALEALRVSSPVLLLTKCFGLSLSDQYWARPSNKPLEWKDVNFFENEFSEDVGNALFERAGEGELDLMSPDNTTGGWLKKKWVVADGKRMLLKCGNGPAHQEPLNEVIASAIMRRLGIAHAAYTLTWDDDRPLSACEDFITPRTDLVSAWHIRETGKKPGHVSEYQHFLERCDALGIPGARDSLDRMLAVDYLIVNADRHYNNFGAVRDAETLEWLGLAPVFDCGTSMWYDSVVSGIRPLAEQKSKPFRGKHSEQIELVTDLSWLDFTALRGVEEEYAELSRQSPYIEDNRRDALCYALRERVAMLERAAK
ncbi:MAG: HipA domain-containing protein [Peptococcaceae bacterium]|jgi:hypothetical protein|nr:HipA domain-containing protein [Peptococcaceae bacterium]